MLKIGVSGNRGSFSEEAANYYCHKNKISDYEIVYLISVERVLKAYCNNEINKGFFPRRRPMSLPSRSPALHFPPIPPAGTITTSSACATAWLKSEPALASARIFGFAACACSRKDEKSAVLKR